MITTMITITTMGLSPPTTLIAPTTTNMDTVAGADRGAMLPLLIWLSPAFPVGAFAYSHGLEWAVEAGDIIDAASLRAGSPISWSSARPARTPSCSRPPFAPRRRPIGRNLWRSTRSRSR